MTELLKKQKQLQKSSYDLLEERIEKLRTKSGSQVDAFSKASGMLADMQRLTENINTFLRQYFHEVVSKTIQLHNDTYAEILGVDYKNLHKDLSKALTSIFLKTENRQKIISEIHKKKSKFTEIPEKQFTEKINKVLEWLKQHLSIGTDYYLSLGEEKNVHYHEKPQRVALAIWELGVSEIASIVMTHLLSLVHKDNADDDNSANSRQSFGAEIGESLHMRAVYRFLCNVEKLDTEDIGKALRAYRNDSFDELEQISKPFWLNRTELEVGQQLLDLAIESQIVDEYTKPNDEKNFNYLKLNTTFLKKMSDSDKRIAYSASMIYKPMVIQPRKWEGLYGGGFVSDAGDIYFDLPLIKANSRKDREALKNKQIPKKIIDAVNLVQNTPFQINKRMLKVIENYHEDIKFLKSENRIDFGYYRILRELLVSGIYQKPLEKVYRHFEKVKFIKLKDENLSQKDRQRIKKAYNEIQKAEDKEKLKLDSLLYYDIAKYKQGFDTIVNIANEMLAYEHFYFVWRMDFRGRIYPQQTLLHPQAGDLPKSLLLFSYQKPLNEEGKKWFYIHGANTYGAVDKRCFDERIAWIKKYHEKILASARDFKNESFWKKADDPFKFLAFCFEYERYISDPDHFTTGLPIAIDGSNNGFQHIATLLRDPEGARKVNVLPTYQNDKLIMQDFYEEVATKLQQKMKMLYKNLDYNKEQYLNKNDKFYKKSEKDEFYPGYHLDIVIEAMEKVDHQGLKHGQFFTTFIADLIKWPDNFKKSEYRAVEDLLEYSERKIRKEVSKEDTEEIKYSLIDELQKLKRRADRMLKKEEIFLVKQKAYQKSEVLTLEPIAYYGRFLDANFINRGFVKGPVMTESYGSSTEGKARALLDKIESGGILFDLTETERYKIAADLARMLESALQEVSPSPEKYKKWMQRYAKKITLKDQPVRWITPLGMEITQVEYKTKKVKIPIDDYRKVTFNIYTDELDPNEHRKGFSPNFIHSLDATHLFLTINTLAKKEITDIITVHDSLATHANDVGVLSLTLREEFTSLHKEEILAELSTFIKKTFDIEEKKIPYSDKEHFDFSEILQSEYFFA